ncbi:A24 family peptidase [Enterovirga aerilata]|uniref:Peptidase n=1 Tax=Enterovirga aerilata TaxID=2730920 RepID=A0A849I642_9HYPH|nr:prepilin peptidase [Enterovirga sp. DB1703]NNM74942.1 peptidase [Enterovirga sp. DB1703]
MLGPLEIAILVVFPILMAYAAASDLLTMTIPNRLSLALVAGFVALACIGGLTAQAILLHVLAGAFVLAVTFAMFALGWIGGGDAKLAAATALWLGFESLLEYLFIAALCGGGLTLAILVLRHFPLPRFALGWTWLSRMHDRRSGVPYGIALAAAALAVYPQSQIWAVALGH